MSCILQTVMEEIPIAKTQTLEALISAFEREEDEQPLLGVSWYHVQRITEDKLLGRRLQAEKPNLFIYEGEYHG